MTEEEFVAHYTECAIPLLRFAEYKFGTLDAEDLAATTWLKAWKYRDQFTAASKFKTWLMRIMINEGYTEMRKRAHRPEEVLTASIEAIVKDSITPERIAVGEQSIANIKRRMTRSQSQLFTMRFLYGMRTEDIGGKLHMNVNTVKTTLSRMRIASLKQI